MGIDWPAPPSTAWAVACCLLDVGPCSPNELDAAAFDRWSTLAGDVEDRFEGHGGELTDDDLMWLASRPLELDLLHHARAIAHGLDRALSKTFTGSWRTEVGRATEHLVADGERYPVSDWLPLPEGATWSIRPTASPPGDDELDHIRTWRSDVRAGGAPVALRFRFDATKEVDAAAEAAVGSLHPNAGTDEFQIPDGQDVFPVVPTLAAQADRYIELLELLAFAEPGLVVGGELAAPDEVDDRVQRWLDGRWTGAPIVVSGSQHCRRDGSAMNVARVLRADAEPFERRKIVPWDRLRSDGPARREGIEPGPREVVVWVGTWARFSVLICRDFLDASLRAATERAGVNLLAVPAFSDEMAAHIGHVRAFVTTTQGRVAVVNNPTSHEGNQVLPSAVFGQPVEGRELQELVAPSTSPTGGGLDSLGNVPRWIGKTW